MPSLSRSGLQYLRSYTSCKLCLQRRQYQSSYQPASPPFTSEESSILSSALRHVPEYGFSAAALSRGAKDAGFLDVTTNLFPRGLFDLVNYHLVSQRLALKDSARFLNEKTGVGARVRALTLARLRGNGAMIGRWQEALALMAIPSNITPSLAELARLSDEIWFLAGDSSVDSSWYTKRATLSAIYSSTELFMTTDESPEFKETEEFLDRRLKELKSVGSGLGAIGEWAMFSAQGAINVARSKGVNL